MYQVGKSKSEKIVYWVCTKPKSGRTCPIPYEEVLEAIRRQFPEVGIANLEFLLSPETKCLYLRRKKPEEIEEASLPGPAAR